MLIRLILKAFFFLATLPNISNNNYPIANLSALTIALTLLKIAQKSQITYNLVYPNPINGVNNHKIAINLSLNELLFNSYAF